MATTKTGMPTLRGPGRNRATKVPKRGKVGDTYDLLHRAWRAGAIIDFYYGRAEYALGVERGERRAQLVWDLHMLPTFERRVFDADDYAGVQQYALDALAFAGIERVEWGPRWMGRRDVIVTLAEARAEEAA